MVLCIMFVIYVMINMYSIASLQSHLHLSVRAESGRISGVTDVNIGSGSLAYDRYRAAAFAKNIKLSEGKSGGAKTAEGAVSAEYGAGRLTHRVTVNKKSRAYAVRETGGIRGILRK
jgi:hypothetical protein